MMNDLGICKKIAEIEGYVASTFNNELHIESGKVASPMSSSGLYMSHKKYNPLTDGALNHQLMIKYKVEISWNPQLNSNCTATIDGTSDEVPYPFAIADVNDENPNRAILLAIIEANKEKK
jgi:hypothetical protein